MKNSTLGFALLLATTAFPNTSWGQSSAPALMNVNEVVVQFARTGNPKAASTCGLVREDIMETIIKILSDESIPVTPINNIKPLKIGVARIDLIPEIVSIATSMGDCTSWISLSAQSQSNVRIPPIESPRSVIVTYWRSGMLVNSSQTIHSRLLDETALKLAKSFAKQYKIDQPPPLPNLDETEETKKPTP